MLRRYTFITLVCLIVLSGSIRAHAGRNEAENLWEEGSKASEAKQYQRAIQLFERSLSLCAGDLDCRWANLNGLGVVYDAMDQNETARRYYEQTLQLSRQRNNPDDLANDLLNLGAVLYKGLELYQQALPLFDEALGLSRKSGNREMQALLLFHSGTVRLRLGRYQEALRALQESLTLNRGAGNDLGTSNALATLAQIYNESGQYAQSSRYFDEAIAIQRRKGLDEDLAASLNRKGLNEFDLKRVDAALAAFDEALRIARHLDNRQLQANILNNLGVVQMQIGQYERARSYYQQTLELANQLGRKGLLAVAANNLGQVYSALGQQEQALQQYQQALQLNRTIGDTANSAINLNNIAMVHYQARRYDEAIQLNREVLTLRRRLGNQLDIALSLTNLAACYLFKGDLATAEQLLDERRRLQLPQSGVHLRNPGLTEVYLQTGRYGQALELLQQDRPSAQLGEPVLAEHAMQTGRALMGLGRYTEATPQLVKAYALLEELRASANDKSVFLSSGGAGGRYRTYRALTASVAEQALRGEDTSSAVRPYGMNNAEAAFYFAEATKARSLVERVAEAGRHSVASAGLPERVRQEEQQLREQLALLNNERDAALRGGSARYAEYQQQRAELHRRFDRFVSDLQQRYPLYAAINYPRPVSAQQLPLAADEVLLEYALGEQACYLFVVKKGGVQRIVRLPFGRAALEDKVKRFLEPLTGHHQQDFSLAQAAELYRLLLADGLAGVGPHERLVIVPDGILGTLPFEILAVQAAPAPAEQVYLGDRFAVAYYQSAALLALKRTLPAQTASRTLFALANPDFGTNGDTGASFRGLAITPKQHGQQISFPPLPETETEVRRIAGLFGTTVSPPDILLGQQASEAMLQRVPLGEYRYLHFATHASLPGLVREVNEPFILLSQRDKSRTADGFLTLSEVLDLRLHAELVMLSACVTGVGKEVEGEGVANFARAFQSAGAQSVVVSLWEVASEPAVEYVTWFYGFLKQGKSHAQALRLARDKMRAKYPNPFYWGVFVLHGEG